MVSLSLWQCASLAAGLLIFFAAAKGMNRAIGVRAVAKTSASKDADRRIQR